LITIKKKNDDEKLKTKSGGSQGKVYRGDGEEVDVDQINEMFKSLDFENYKEKTLESNETGKLSVLKFKGDKENSQKNEDILKSLYISLKAKNAEINLVEKSYNCNVKLNYKYKEDEIDVEEELGFSIELYCSNDKLSTTAVLLKDENTNIFTFKKFVSEWKDEFNCPDE